MADTRQAQKNFLDYNKQQCKTQGSANNAGESVEDREIRIVKEYLLEHSENWFRPFTEGLETFMDLTKEKGRIPASKSGKIDYIIKLRNSKEMTIPSDSTIESWFKKKSSRPTRENAIALCFILGATLGDANWFLTNVCFMSELSSHIIEDACYDFCLENGLPYNEANEMAEEIRSFRFEPVSEDEYLSTNILRDEFSLCSTKESFLSAMKKRRGEFERNYISARNSIKELHEELVNQEEDNKYIKACRSRNGAPKVSEECGLLVRYFHKRGYKWYNDHEQYIVSPKLIYRLVLDETINTKRGIHTYDKKSEVFRILSGNFPGTDALRKFLQSLSENPHFDDSERLRKMIIFLCFVVVGAYKFLNPEYPSEFTLLANDYLDKSNLPPLHMGNPFDIFMMFCSLQDDPIAFIGDFLQDMNDNNLTQPSNN